MRKVSQTYHLQKGEIEELNVGTVRYGEINMVNEDSNVSNIFRSDAFIAISLRLFTTRKNKLCMNHEVFLCRFSTVAFLRSEDPHRSSKSVERWSAL